MKIPLYSINPKVTELIESNNQHEALFEIMRNKITTLEKKVQSLEDWKKEQHLRQMNKF